MFSIEETDCRDEGKGEQKTREKNRRYVWTSNAIPLGKHLNRSFQFLSEAHYDFKCSEGKEPYLQCEGTLLILKIALISKQSKLSRIPAISEILQLYRAQMAFAAVTNKIVISDFSRSFADILFWSGLSSFTLTTLFGNLLLITHLSAFLINLNFNLSFLF